MERKVESRETDHPIKKVTADHTVEFMILNQQPPPSILCFSQFLFYPTIGGERQQVAYLFDISGEKESWGGRSIREKGKRRGMAVKSMVGFYPQPM